jgi:hypothetical protein
MLNQFPTIDYEKHPAFDPCGDLSFEDAALERLVGTLDALRAAVEQNRRAEGEQGGMAEVFGEVDSVLCGIRAALLRSRMPAVALELALASLARAEGEFKAWLHFAVMRRRMAGSSSELGKKGSCIVGISPALKRRFEAEAARARAGPELSGTEQDSAPGLEQAG